VSEIVPKIMGTAHLNAGCDRVILYVSLRRDDFWGVATSDGAPCTNGFPTSHSLLWTFRDGPIARLIDPSLLFFDWERILLVCYCRCCRPSSNQRSPWSQRTPRADVSNRRRRAPAFKIWNFRFQTTVEL